MEVAAGTADAAVLDLTLANAMIGAGTDYASLKIVDELNAEEYGVAFRKGSDVPDAVKDVVAAVNASKERIAQLEASKPRKDEPAVDESEVTFKVCPVCGAASDSKFCPHCGAPMGE